MMVFPELESIIMKAEHGSNAYVSGRSVSRFGALARLTMSVSGPRVSGLWLVYPYIAAGHQGNYENGYFCRNGLTVRGA